MKIANKHAAAVICASAAIVSGLPTNILLNSRPSLHMKRDIPNQFQHTIASTIQHDEPDSLHNMADIHPYTCNIHDHICHDCHYILCDGASSPICTALYQPSLLVCYDDL
jgi:hypothetical protein